jgi:molybdate transport system regulatory protein
VKFWLESGGESVLCRHLSEILQAVEKTGSIKEAAAVVGRSYRFVWARIKGAEESLGATLVETRVGGRDARRSGLTPLARDLVESFDVVSRELSRRVDATYRRELDQLLRRHQRQS